MTSPAPQSDPFGYRAQFVECLAQPEYARALEGSDGDYERNAAYLACENRGYCLLGGLILEEELASPLPLVIATAGARDAVRVAELGARSVEKLPARFDQSRSQLEVDSALAGGLQIRMHLHAAFQAIDETYLEALKMEQDVTSLNEAIDKMSEAMAGLDQRLLDELDLISLICDTNLLENMRAELSAEWREMLPWWLDGTIEDAYERSVAEAKASLPTPAWWARFRNAGDGTLVTLPTEIPKTTHALRPPYTPVGMAASESAPIYEVVRSWRSLQSEIVIELAVQPRTLEHEFVQFEFLRSGDPAENLIGASLVVPVSPPLELPIERISDHQVAATVILGSLREAANGNFPQRLLLNGEPFDIVED